MAQTDQYFVHGPVKNKIASFLKYDKLNHKNIINLNTKEYKEIEDYDIQTSPRYVIIKLTLCEYHLLEIEIYTR